MVLSLVSLLGFWFVLYAVADLLVVGDHEDACMHDLMMHLRDEPQARYSNVHDVLMYRIYIAVFGC
jgi:hypothetical protein